MSTEQHSDELAAIEAELAELNTKFEELIKEANDPTAADGNVPPLIRAGAILKDLPAVLERKEQAGRKSEPLKAWAVHCAEVARQRKVKEQADALAKDIRVLERKVKDIARQQASSYNMTYRRHLLDAGIAVEDLNQIWNEALKS